MKLPKLDLPVFNGDPINWTVFWDLFKTSVHDQPIAKVQKIAYLKNAKLSGPAAAAVAGLSITDDNYDIAINALKDRFGKDSVVKGALFPNCAVCTLQRQLSKICGTFWMPWKRH